MSNRLRSVVFSLLDGRERHPDVLRHLRLRKPPFPRFVQRKATHRLGNCPNRVCRLALASLACPTWNARGGVPDSRQRSSSARVIRPLVARTLGNSVAVLSRHHINTRTK